MIVIWAALLGILFKLTIAHRFKILSLTYLAMGWLSLVVIYEMAVARGLRRYLTGGSGVVYSLGVIFTSANTPYNHYLARLRARQWLPFLAIFAIGSEMGMPL